MKKTYDEISGQTRWETKPRVLFQKGGFFVHKQFIKSSIILVRSAQGDSCWLWLHLQTHKSAWDVSTEVWAMLDDHRTQFSAEIEDYVPGISWLDIGLMPSDLYAHALSVAVSREWLSRCADSRAAKVRVDNHDVELPGAFKNDAAAILKLMN